MSIDLSTSERLSSRFHYARYISARPHDEKIAEAGPLEESERR
jgi:hypothetical protein